MTGASFGRAQEFINKLNIQKVRSSVTGALHAPASLGIHSRGGSNPRLYYLGFGTGSNPAPAHVGRGTLPVSRHTSHSRDLHSHRPWRCALLLHDTSMREPFSMHAGAGGFPHVPPPPRALRTAWPTR